MSVSCKLLKIVRRSELGVLLWDLIFYNGTHIIVMIDPDDFGVSDCLHDCLLLKSDTRKELLHFSKTLSIMRKGKS